MAIRAITSCSTLPIIIFSGSDDEACVVASYLAGANHYLCKPTLPERMGRVVRSLYEGAMTPPRTFNILTGLREYLPSPFPTGLTRPSAYVAG